MASKQQELEIIENWEQIDDTEVITIPFTQKNTKLKLAQKPN